MVLEAGYGGIRILTG